MSYSNSQSFFQEDGLPDSEAIIETHSVMNFVTQADFLIHCKAQNKKTMIGITTGRPGSGKTVAIQYYLHRQRISSPVVFPPCIMIRVSPQASSKALAEAIYTCFGQKARRSNSRHEILEDAAEAVLSNNVKLILVDEAEQLEIIGFEFLRYISDITGCPILLVGSPEILRKVRSQEKFVDRVGSYMEFQDPSEQEVLETILPQLQIPFWHFDPSSARDVERGKDLWRSVQPSFRHLCVVIHKASGLIGWQNQQRITRSELQNAFRSSLQIPKEAPFNEEIKEEKDHPDRTEAEELSEAKKDAKLQIPREACLNEEIKEEKNHSDRTEAEELSEAKKDAKREKPGDGEQS
jgi:type II secretory pathway predicted ATPase ExeA